MGDERRRRSIVCLEVIIESDDQSGVSLQDIGHKIAKGIAYNTIARILIVGIQGVTSIFLARILSSEDYGIVAFAAIFVSFLSQFSDFGLGSALVQRQDVSQRVLNTAFTMRNIVAFVLVAIALLISFVVPYLYDYQGIEWVIRLMAFNFVLNSLGFISVVMLKREMNFLLLNIASFLSTITGSFISVFMAYAGYGFWSLVWAGLLSTLVYVATIKIVKPIKLKYEVEKESAKELLNFGGFIFISGLMIYLIFNASNFVVGSVQGPIVLGYFSLALDWGTKIPILLSQTVLSVLFPAFSAVRNDPELLKKTYTDSLKYVAFFAVLVNGTLACVAEDFLIVILGAGTDKWIPALTAFQILCVYGIIRAILEPIGNVVVALGDSKVLFKANLLAAIVQIIFIYPVLKLYNIQGVSLLLVFSYVLQYFIFMSYIKFKIKISFLKIIKEIIISSFLMLLSYYVFNHFKAEFNFVNFSVKLFIYGSVFFISFGFMTKWDMIIQINNALKRR